MPTISTRSRFSAARMIRWTLAADIVERLLDQDVQVGRERGQNVRLVQVVGRADHHRVEARRAEQVLDVVERVLARRTGRRARAPSGRSVSQIACTSIDLSFLSTGRWATWAMAPPPTMPTRRRSLVAPAGRHAVSSLSRDARATRPDSRRRGCARGPAPRASGRRRPIGRSPTPCPAPAAVRHQPGDPAAGAARR